MTRWPRTLWGQLAALLVLGLALAWGLSLLAATRQRAHMLDAMVLPHVGRDVASALDLLDQLPAAQRPAWLERLSRPSYRIALQAAEPAAAAPGFEPQLMQAVARQAGAHRVLGPGALPGGERALRLRLRDGTDAALVWRLTGTQAAWQGPALLLAQLAVVALCVGVAARRVTAPLARLAQAAQRLGADPQSPPLPEDGPLEVRQAAAAFNAMQRRIARHLDERLEILAAVSHDLKTPLTRLRMRCELMDGHPQRERLQADLDEMQHLVEEGLAYARSAHAATEPAEPVDLPALLHTLVCDRLDAGQAVHWSAPAGPLTLRTRPQALRRIVGNLLDNALKFAGAAELQLSREDGALCIDVLDRGPGIPAAELPRMLEPFQRLDASRSRDTGGSGLGLAIAVRLAQALGAELQLGPRPGGGLQARLKLPTP